MTKTLPNKINADDSIVTFTLTINRIIDYLTPEPEEKKTCGKLMSVGALTGDTYCANPVPCYLHARCVCGELELGTIADGRVVGDMFHGKDKPCHQNDNPPPDKHNYKLQERLNSAYKKGQDNGIKQGRKMEREKVMRTMAVLENSLNASLSRDYVYCFRQAMGALKIELEKTK